MNPHRSPDRRGSLIGGDNTPADDSAVADTQGWELLAPATAASPRPPEIPSPEPTIGSTTAAVTVPGDPPDVTPAGHRNGIGAEDDGEPDLLSAPIDDSDLAQTLARTRGRPRPSATTTVLAALLLAAVAFTGGVFARTAMAPAAATSAGRSTATGTSGGAAAARNFGGAGGASGAAATGTVQLVDGTTVYVQTATGGVTKILTSPGTTIRVTTTGTVKDLTPGTTVVVQGTRDADGTVQASGITQGGTGGAGRAGAGTNGGTGTAGSASATSPAG